MFCYRENMTLVGDHCEYFQCHANCYQDTYLGLCFGWDISECVYMDTTGIPLVYDPDYNDYLECYKFCSGCVDPWVN